MSAKQHHSIDDWHKFEKLTGALFKVAFGLNKEEFILTRAVKDGGKDAIISKLLTAHGLGGIEIQAWIEAKYRKKDNVDLGDIGGNVIIASNSSIRSIYFVTNQSFTPQAIEQLLIFQVRTGLQIELIDGYRYRNLLEKHLPRLRKMVYEDIEIPHVDFIDFAEKLFAELPTTAPSIEYKVSLTVERGRITQTKSIANLCNDEVQLERRVVDLSSILESKETIALSKAELIPIVYDKDINNNPNYELIGEARKNLLNQTLTLLKSGKTVVIKGTAGQGKTFFSSHIARAFYQDNNYVLFVDVGNQDISSITRNIILDVIGIDYFKYMEDRAAVVEYLSQYYSIEPFVANKVIDLVQMNHTTKEISSELCFRLLLKLFENNAGRKGMLLVVDNLHMATLDVLALLKNLFGFLNQIAIPVLVLTRKQNDQRDASNDWLSALDAMIDSNGFASMTMPGLEESDIRNFIKMLVPGASVPLVNLIVNNTFPIPFYIKLYVDFLKTENIIKSRDGQYWLLDEKHLEVHLDSSIIKNQQIEQLVTSKLKEQYKDGTIRKIAQVVFIFNNELPEALLKNIIPEIQFETAASSGLFHASLIGNEFVLAFSHDLYYHNFKGSLLNPTEELNFQSLRVLAQISGEQFAGLTIRDDVLGTLYEYTGDSKSACAHYRKFANKQKSIDGFRALLFMEKALDSFLLPSGIVVSDELYNQELVDIIFELLTLYDRYNLLANRKSTSLYLLLERLLHIEQLNKPQQMGYLLFKGIRETKAENFWVAKEILEEALKLLKSHKEVPDILADNIIINYGINLKHVGRKEESLTFFDSMYKERKSKHINVEKYSNEAAYYLTTAPEKSLKCYEFIRDEIGEKEGAHWILNFGMVYFYLKQYDLSRQQLERALRLAKQRSNLVEEARAENILGILLWKDSKTKLAEEYFDLAAANCELANNHRWLWRIRTNQAQIAMINSNVDKAYNIGWSVLQHLSKTREAIGLEFKNTSLNSRRVAALKAIFNLYHKMNKTDDVLAFNELLDISEIQTFWKQLKKHQGLQFDHDDSNRSGDWYHILG
ncbi:MAG: restriction endonuclease [Bacteroidia bacterium]|nr:restriction endonuclease [Bacteroidia bacterium]